MPPITNPKISKDTPVRNAPIHSKRTAYNKVFTLNLLKKILRNPINNSAPPIVRQICPTVVKMVLKNDPATYRKFDPKKGTIIATNPKIPTKTRKVRFGLRCLRRINTSLLFLAIGCSLGKVDLIFTFLTSRTFLKKKFAFPLFSFKYNYR